jgi:c-di-GMP-binding flagellar brake protein YcgR
MSFFKKLFQKTVHQATDNSFPAEPSRSIHIPPAESNLSLASKIPDEFLPLWQLYKQRQLLEVKISSANRVYQSMIIALDIERGLLWLDDLFPQQLILEVGDELVIRHHRQGEQLLIRASILALGSNYGASGIAILLPDNTCYTPRRVNLRFNVVGETPTMVKIRTLGQEPCFGTLQDISAGGLRINVAGNFLSQLRHGLLLPLCEFNLSNELQIRCRAKVCAFRITRSPYRCTQISLEFVDLPEHKREAITHFLQRTPSGVAAQFFAA